jgi:hypothetical protein
MFRLISNSCVVTFISVFSRFVASLPEIAMQKLSYPIWHQFYQNLYQYVLDSSSVTQASQFNRVQAEMTLATCLKRSRQPYKQQEYLLLQSDTPVAGDPVDLMISRQII